MAKFLIIGGRGSMGKRRIRDLTTLGHEVLSWDIKDEKKMPTPFNFDALIISTPPDQHNRYIFIATQCDKPCFIEASVILNNLEHLNEIAKARHVLICPSCSMRFNPIVKGVKEFVKNNKVLNFAYHLGQYLPDWHPNEKDSYFWRKETGGAREMVPFELTWITDIFGFPKRITGLCGKTENWEIDDTYSFSADFGGIFGSFLIDVVSRKNTRDLTLVTDKDVVGFDLSYIPEEMYLEEMKAFILTIKGEKQFPNTLEDDIKILKLLNEIEK